VISLPGCREHFYDLSKLRPKQRAPRSPIMQIYSAAPNIGNYLPVLGIQRMLGTQPDVWHISDPGIDFEFINRHYRCCIIGGAGLVHKCFEPFWKAFFDRCKLPTIVWGVGGCFPDLGTKPRVQFPDSMVDAGIAGKVFGRCDLVNVRDDVTANRYELKDASIAACPTIIHLRDYVRNPWRKTGYVLFSSHEELLQEGETEEIKEVLAREVGLYRYTKNHEAPLNGLSRILDQFADSRLVVTTRLHGAIIAYGLGVPYVCIARDEKVRAFNRLYGGGVNVEDISTLPDAIGAAEKPAAGSIAYDAVLAFGERAREWAAAHTQGCAVPDSAIAGLETP